ncbi:MAG: hypothetical protein GY806_05040 [Gammaproteobacteria bacterium]|nr:hypothetical protein [Gammaproteobacteria bacterium]
MQGKLRQRYQVHKEVSRRGYFEGLIDIVNLNRLTDLLASDEGQIEVRFEFVNSDYSIPMMSGQVKTSLNVECQRCLQPMLKELQLEFNLLIDATDELIRETKLETLFSEDGFIDIFEVIEDEIILALPLVAMHKIETCNEHWQVAEEIQQPAVKENPFSVLKDLKITH